MGTESDVISTVKSFSFHEHAWRNHWLFFSIIFLPFSNNLTLVIDLWRDGTTVFDS